MIAFTGHRSDKLGGYGADAEARLLDFALLLLPALQEHYGRSVMLTGMALGWDQVVAEACAKLGVPYVAAVPFPDQPVRWPPSARQRWERLCRQAAQVHVLESEFSAAALHRRNEWMVDRAARVCALFSGAPGGTLNCIRYARAKGRCAVNVWPAWEAHLGGAEVRLDFEGWTLPPIGAPTAPLRLDIQARLAAV